MESRIKFPNTRTVNNDHWIRIIPSYANESQKNKQTRKKCREMGSQMWELCNSVDNKISIPNNPSVYMTGYVIWLFGRCVWVGWFLRHSFALDEHFALTLPAVPENEPYHGTIHRWIIETKAVISGLFAHTDLLQKQPTITHRLMHCWQLKKSTRFSCILSTVFRFKMHLQFVDYLPVELMYYPVPFGGLWLFLFVHIHIHIQCFISVSPYFFPTFSYTPLYNSLHFSTLTF